MARPGVGAVSTQNITLPSLGPAILDLLAAGAAPRQALEQALDADPWRQHRQVTVIDAQGRTASFTGSGALGVHHVVEAENCVAAGNLLSNTAVIGAMASAFERAAGPWRIACWRAWPPAWPRAAKPAPCIRRR